VGTGSGGRKPKKPENQVNQVVKTTLTLTDLNRLKSDYQHDTRGQQVSFAEYIRQRLTSPGAGRGGGPDRHNGLAIQVELAEISSQLTTLSRNSPADAKADSPSLNPIDRNEYTMPAAQLGTLTHRLEETIEQISRWLYGSSQEKI
jgi:hypothetical protein